MMDEAKPTIEPTGFDPVSKLADWYRVKAQLAEVQEQERALRAQLFTHYFPAPVEGTNTVVLPDGYQLKGKYPIDRKLDDTTISTLRSLLVKDLSPAFRQEVRLETQPDDKPVCEAMLLNLDALVRHKPELSVTAYRTLTQEQRRLVDCFLTIKPGSIALEVAPPAKRAAVGGKP